MPRSSSGFSAELLKQPPVAGLGRDMRGSRMGQARCVQPGERRRCGRADEAVEQQRDTVLAARRGWRRRSRRARARRRRRARRADRQVPRHDASTAASTAAALRASPASSTPVPRPTQSAPAPPNSAAAMAAAAVVLPMPISPRQRRSASLGHGIVSGRDRGEEFGLRHRRRDREIGGRPLDLQRHDLESGAGRARELVDGGAAGREIGHHLRRHFRGKGRNAARGDAVRAGKDDDFDLVQPRHCAALPAGQPGGELLEPAEAALRLGQRVLAGKCGGSLPVAAGRQVQAGRTQSRRSEVKRVIRSIRSLM